MAISLVGNTTAASVQRHLQVAQAKLQQSSANLASGLRILSASDDPAGLAISDRLGAEVRSLTQASRNASDGLSALQTADGGLSGVSSILTRMQELTTQAATGLLSDTQRAAIDAEFQTLRQEIDRTAASTTFNGTTLLDGSLASPGVSLQVGTDSGAASQIAVQIPSVGSADLGGATPLSSASVATVGGAQAAFASVDAALTAVSQARGEIGAGMRRIQSASEGIAAKIEKLTAAQATIRDVDVAKESAQLVRAQILTQAGVSVLAQANQQPRRVLKLIR